jgi:FkbM family methyltransferase
MKAKMIGQRETFRGHVKRLLRQVVSMRGYELTRMDQPLRGATPEIFTTNYVRPVEVIFDVGANIGQSVDRYHRFFPEASITSFEPVAENYAKLQQVAAGIPKARALRFALGEEFGQAKIYVPDETQMSTLLPEGSDQPAQAVSVETFDRVREQLGVPFVDLLKMDVEGFELQVIRGASRSLGASKVGMIYAEAGLRDDNTCHTHFGSLYAALRPYGFRSFGLYDIKHWEGSRLANRLFKETLYGNALFIHESQLRGLASGDQDLADIAV